MTSVSGQPTVQQIADTLMTEYLPQSANRDTLAILAVACSVTEKPSLRLFAAGMKNILSGVVANGGPHYEFWAPLESAIKTLLAGCTSAEHFTTDRTPAALAAFCIRPKRGIFDLNILLRAKTLYAAHNYYCQLAMLPDITNAVNTLTSIAALSKIQMEGLADLNAACKRPTQTVAVLQIIESIQSQVTGDQFSQILSFVLDTFQEKLFVQPSPKTPRLLEPAREKPADTESTAIKRLPKDGKNTYTQEQKTHRGLTDIRLIGYPWLYSAVDPVERIHIVDRVMQDVDCLKRGGQVLSERYMVSLALLVLSMSYGAKFPLVFEWLEFFGRGALRKHGDRIALRVEIPNGDVSEINSADAWAYEPVVDELLLMLPIEFTDLIQTASELQKHARFHCNALTDTYLSKIRSKPLADAMRAIPEQLSRLRKNVLRMLSNDNERIASMICPGDNRDASTAKYYDTCEVRFLISMHDIAVEAIWSRTYWDRIAPVKRSPPIKQDAMMAGSPRRMKFSAIQHVESSLARVITQKSLPTAERFNATTLYLLTFLHITTGHRIVADGLAEANKLDLWLRMAEFDDKAVTTRHLRRLVPLGDTLINAFLEYAKLVERLSKKVICQQTAARLRALSVAIVASPGEKTELPMFFLICTQTGSLQRLTQKAYKRHMRELTGITQCYFRSFLSSALLELAVDYRDVHGMLGHVSNEHPWGARSTGSIEERFCILRDAVEVLVEPLQWQPKLLSMLRPSKPLSWTLSFSGTFGAASRLEEREKHNNAALHKLDAYLQKSLGGQLPNSKVEIRKLGRELSGKGRQENAAIKRAILIQIDNARSNGLTMDPMMEWRHSGLEQNPIKAKTLKYFQWAASLEHYLLTSMNPKKTENVGERAAHIIISLALFTGRCSESQLHTFFEALSRHAWWHDQVVHVDWFADLSITQEEGSVALPVHRVTLDHITQGLIDGTVEKYFKPQRFYTEFRKIDVAAVEKRLRVIFLDAFGLRREISRPLALLAVVSRARWTLKAPGYLRALYRGQQLEQALSQQRYRSLLDGMVLAVSEAKCEGP